jgi:amino acid transporter
MMSELLLLLLQKRNLFCYIEINLKYVFHIIVSTIIIIVVVIIIIIIIIILLYIFSGKKKNFFSPFGSFVCVCYYIFGGFISIFVSLRNIYAQILKFIGPN